MDMASLSPAFQLRCRFGLEFSLDFEVELQESLATQNLELGNQRGMGKPWSGCWVVLIADQCVDATTVYY